MKTLRLALLFTCLCHSLFSYGAKKELIFIDSAAHALVAPEGEHYQWFYNGHKVEGATAQAITVRESGTYEVQVADEEGSVSIQNATVAVTATGAIIRIYLLGDSTVSNYNATTQYPQAGWGQVLGKFFNEANVQVINKAVGGRSSRSYYEGPSAIWPGFKDQIKAGDYAFIQFGHNDASSVPERYTSVPNYKVYLKKYIDELRAKGAFPVLVTPMIQNYYTGSGTIQQSLLNYATAMKEVATAQKVPLVDLNQRSYNLYSTFSKEYNTRFIYNTYVAGEYPAPSAFSAGNINNGKNGDGTHFQVMGAIENARLIIQGLKEMTQNASTIADLLPAIKPQYAIAVSVNPKGADSHTTRTATYPAGLTITLKTLPKTGSSFVKWIDAAGNTVSTKTLVTTVVTGTSPTSYTAVYKGASSCAATISRSGSTTLCQGESINLVSNAGTTYLWKNGSAQVGSAAAYKAITSGTYTVEVTDANGCKATSDPVIVQVNASAVWYADADGDSKGDPASSKTACEKPSGYVADKTDGCPSDAEKSAPGNCGCGKTETSCTLGIEEASEEHLVSAFPNPFQGEITLTEYGKCSYRILTISGQEAAQGLINGSGSVGGQLPSGVYLLEIIKGTQIKRLKITKN